MLRKIFALTACLIAVGPVLSADETTVEEQKPLIGKESVRFDEETLVLAYAGEEDGEAIKEFIPAGQTLESWTKLAAIRTYAEIDDPQAFADGMVRALKQRDANPDYQLKVDRDSGAVLLSFVVWPEDRSFAEFNIFKLEKAPTGGLVSSQYALRAYNDPEEFVQSLTKELRLSLVSQMAIDGLTVKTPDANKGDGNDDADEDEDADDNN